MKLIRIIASLLIITVAILAKGAHDDITCLGCHSAHFAMGNKAFAVKNTYNSAINPRTGKSLDGLVASRCLGCHQLEKFGGAGVRPIHLHITHPIGMIPNKKIADVPESMLNDGRMDCISCHEAHPSNDNFMYLRVDTDNGKTIQNFCVICHSVKGDLKAMGIDDISDVKVFSAMDQSAGSTTGSREDIRVHNPTPNYITPLGKIPKNTITPNYLNPPKWIYNPEIDPTRPDVKLEVKKVVEEVVEKVVTKVIEEVKVVEKVIKEAIVEVEKKIEKPLNNTLYEYNQDGYMYIPSDGNSSEEYERIRL